MPSMLQLDSSAWPATYSHPRSRRQSIPIRTRSCLRAIVITGAGRAFSSGADIAAFQRYIETGPAVAVAQFMRPGHRMTRRVESFPKPIVAAVNGLAFGGGCELVEATHIALAAEKAGKGRSHSHNWWELMR